MAVGWNGFWIGGAALLSTVLPLPALVLGQPPARPGELALVIAPPWAGERGVAGVIERLSGQPIGPTQAPFAAFAIIEDPGSARAAGAWLVLDGRRIAALCGISL